MERRGSHSSDCCCQEHTRGGDTESRRGEGEALRGTKALTAAALCTVLFCSAIACLSARCVLLCRWKNWQLKKRRAGATCCELLFPVGAVMILLMIRTLVKIDSVDIEIPVQDKAMASANVPFLFGSLACGVSVSSGSNSLNERYKFQGLALAAGPNLPGGAQNPDLLVVAGLFRQFFNATAAALNYHVPCCFFADPSRPNVTNAGCYLDDDALRTYATDPASPMVRLFGSDDEMDSYIQSKDYGWHDTMPLLTLGAVLDRDPAHANRWTYTLRANSSDVPFTGGPQLNTLATGYVRNDFFKYYDAHVLTLQWVLESFIISQALPHTAEATASVAAGVTPLRVVEREPSLFASAGPAAALAAVYDAIPSFLPPGWHDLGFLSMPVPAHRQDNFKQYVAQVMGLFLVIAFMWPFSRMMKMMGLRNSVFWCSWVITYLIFFALVVVLVILVSKGSLFKYSDGTLLFFFFFAFCLSLISLACLVTTFFSRAKTAGTLSPFVLLAGYLPYFGVSDPSKSMGGKGLACLFSPVALSLGANNLISYEGVFVGGQWDNAREVVDNFQLQTALAMMLFDAVLYAVIAWYLDQVWPKEFGTHRPWYFLFTPSYWRECCCSCTRRRKPKRSAIPRGVFGDDVDPSSPTPRRMSIRGITNSGSITPSKTPIRGGGPRGGGLMSGSGSGVNSSSYGSAASAILSEPLIMSDEIDWEPEPDFGPDYEPVPADMRSKAGVKIRGLRKEFSRDGNEVTAVEGLDLNLYEGQCFVLLGHNGAGKTTTISMLTGMTTATSGTATLFGRDINHEMTDIRTFMGVCPQHDVLFPTLTVYEHLEFFGKLKGIRLPFLHAAVMEAIKEVQLKPKINTQSAALSGGQRRRLSLAIALIGDSKVVFLDEPTSGVDPFSRRAIWDLLTKKKHGRILVLTTHFMDEADQLGDRIGIMHHGRMKCCGTSLFLKAKFGVGYCMTLVKDPARAKVDQVTSLVRRRVPDASMLSSVGSELSYSLPFSASSVFPLLLGEIDAQMPALGIVNYGLSVTTMEEVFIKVAEEVRPGSKDDVSHASSTGAAGGGAGDHREALSGADLSQVRASWCTHFRALLSKRYHIQKRDKKALCCQFLVPLILLSLGLGILRIPPNFDFPELVLSPGPESGVFNAPDRIPFNAGLDPAVWENVHSPQEGSMELIAAGGAGTGQGDLYNFSVALLDGRTQYKQSRYGAFFGTALDAVQYGESAWELSILTNVSATHGLPTWANLGQQALLRHAASDPTASITAQLHPFAWTPRQRTAIQSINGVVASIVISLAFTFIPASFAVFVVGEREHKAKHLQLISGVSMSSYWAANFVWDFCCYVVPASISALIIYLYQNPSLVANMDVLLVSFFAYGVSIIPFTYLLSFLFSSHSTAQNVMIMVYILGGILMTNTAVALLLVPSTESISKHYLRHFFRLIPSFCLGDAIFYISWLPFMNGLGKWDLLVTGYDILYMLVEAVVYFALTLVVDKLSSIPSFVGLFKKDPAMIPPPPGKEEEPEDEDVRAERERLQASALPTGHTKFLHLTDAIESMGSERAVAEICAPDPESQQRGGGGGRGGAGGPLDLIRLEGLRKIYPGKNAVKDVYFGIPAGQCFGFLGVNGAGKTTTLKILTGDVTPTQGQAFIGGYSIAHYPAEVRRLMGYCPQFDALFELMTARETLNFYGTIRGIPSEQMARMVTFLIDRLSLTEYADRPCGTYSGGNKRKLSVAIALIGSPPVVFLDEPSTGMDPVSRRFMWDFISETMTNRAVILTTHSMEECEALCSRIGMLVNGAMKCIGPAQHLKSRFGRGFQVDISTGSNDSSQARAFLLQHFPDAEKLEDYAGKLKYKILASGHRDESQGGAGVTTDAQGKSWKLKDIFALIESQKDRVGISEYSVAQTTLEQVFISFAKKGDHEEFGGKLAADAEEEEKEQASHRAREQGEEDESKEEWGSVGGAATMPRGIRGRAASPYGRDPESSGVTPSSFGYLPVDARNINY